MITRLSGLLLVVVACAAAPVVFAQQHKPASPSYSVSGCVNAPGTFAWTKDVTVAKAVAAAGGYKSTGEGTPTIADVRIERRVDGKTETLRVKNDTPVLDGDAVVVAVPK